VLSDQSWIKLLRATVQVFTFIIRGSGFVGRKMARATGRGEPLPKDMAPCMQQLRCYRDIIMQIAHAWSFERAEPTQGQLKARPSPSPSPCVMMHDNEVLQQIHARALRSLKEVPHQ